MYRIFWKSVFTVEVKPCLLYEIIWKLIYLTSTCRCTETVAEMYTRSTVSLLEFLHNDIFVRFQAAFFAECAGNSDRQTPHFPMITVLKCLFMEVLLIALQYYFIFGLK